MLDNQELASLIQQKVRDQLGTLVVEILAKDAQITLLQKELEALTQAQEVKKDGKSKS